MNIATVSESQISLRLAQQSAMLELQAILRQVHLRTPKWPWTLTRGPLVWSFCLWSLTTCPDIQLRFMLNGHVAEGKYLVFKVQIYLYSSLPLLDQNPKWPWILKGQRYPLCMFTATPNFQIWLRYSLWTHIFELHAIWDKCTKWPQNDHEHQYKIWVHWHALSFYPRF